jgi:transposase
VALEYSKLPNDLEALKQLLLQHSHWVDSLTEEVLRLRRWRFGRSSEVIDVSLLPELPLSGAVVAAPTAAEVSLEGKLAPLPKLLSVDTPNSKRSPRPPRMLPPQLPRIVRVHAPKRCECPECGERLGVLGEDSSEQLDYVPGYFRVIRHVRPKMICSACARIIQAAASSRPIERGLPTAGLLAQVIGAKYADHLPLYRQEGIYRRAGVELPRAVLASWVADAAQLLNPLVGSLEQYVLTATKLHADDTPVPVLAPGKGRTHTARLWAYVRDDRPASGTDPPAVIYRYSPDRKAERPYAHLSSFTGILQADGYSGFNALYTEGRIREAACWAHARRKYHDVYAMDRSAIAAEALGRIGELYSLERSIRGRSASERLAARAEHAAPKLRALREWLNATHRSLSAKSPLASAIQYTLARWEALALYLTDGSIEIDNNAAERAIRALVLGRRNYLFAGSDAGGETAARLYSLIGTCRLNGIDPHLYLRHVIECIASHPINRIAELLPWRVAPHLAGFLIQAA